MHAVDAVDAVEEVGARRVCTGDLHTLRAFLVAAQAPAVASIHRRRDALCHRTVTGGPLHSSRRTAADCGEMSSESPVSSDLLRLDSSRLGHRLANT